MSTLSPDPRVAAPGAARPGADRFDAAGAGSSGVLGGIVRGPLVRATAAAGLTWRRPVLLVVAVVVLTGVPNGSDGADPTAVQLTAADLAAAVLVAVMTIRVAVRGVGRRLPVVLVVPLIAVVVAATAATWTAADPSASGLGFVRYCEIFVLVPLAVCLTITTRGEIAVLLAALLALAGAEGVVGVYQFITGTGAGYGQTSVRAVGTFGAYNIEALGAVLSYAVPVATALAFTATTRGRRAAWWLVAAALAVPLAVSLSRGAWIATAVAVLAVAFAAGWRRGLALVVVATALVVCSLGLFGVSTGGEDGPSVVSSRVASVGSVFSDPGQSVQDRYGLWNAATGMWAQHPVTGVGIKGFPLFRDSYASLDLSSGSDISDASGYRRVPLLSPHNFYLLVLSEQGVLGALAYLPYLAVLLIGVVLRARSGGPAARRLPALAVLGCLVSYLVASFYGDIGGPTTVLVAVLLGLALRVTLGGPATPDTGGRAGPPDATARPPGTAAPADPLALRLASLTWRRAAPGRHVEPPRVQPPPAQIPRAPTPLPCRSRPPRPGWPRCWTRAASRLAGRLARLSQRRVRSTALLVATISAVGSVVGLLRDLIIARYFGASGQTDAFVVSWTIPETAFPLLMDGAMIYLLVPLFSRELAHHRSLRPSIAGTLPVVTSVLVVLTLLTMAGAPEFVHTLAPGLAEPDLAIQSVRVSALTILAFGLAGYLTAALRSSGNFIIPAWTSLAWNVGIVAVVVALHGSLGVYSAAIGLAGGGALTVLIQVPSFVRRVGLPRSRLRPSVDRHVLGQLAVFLPIAAYTLTRQALVYVERYFGSELAPGAITLLNYAEKVAQFSVVAAITVAVVGFPALARTAATGGQSALTTAVERQLRLATLLILPATAFLISQAGSIMTLLFRRGAFTPADAAASGQALAVFSVGLVGQVVVGVGACAFFAVKGVVWPPVIWGAVALTITGVVDATTVDHFGILGLAAGNAAGILVMAVLFLLGLRRWVAPIGLLGITGHLLRCALAAAAAAAPAVLIARVVPSSWPPSIVVGSAGLVFVAASVLTLAVVGVPEVRSVLRSASGRSWRGQ